MLDRISDAGGSVALCLTCSSEVEERNFLSPLPLQQVPLKSLEFTSMLRLCSMTHDTCFTAMCIITLPRTRFVAEAVMES